MPNYTYTPIPFTAATPVVRASILSNTVPMLLGAPGIGKSSMLRALSRILDAKVFAIQINQLADRSDLTGQRINKEKHTTQAGNIIERSKLSFFPHYTIQQAIDYAIENPNKLSIIFLDEINRASSDITSAALSLSTERTIGGQKFPENVRIVAAGNDEGNVIALDSASRTRFRFIKVTPDAETLLANIPDLNPFIKEVITSFPQLVENYGNLTNTITTDPGSSNNDPDDDNEESFELDFELDFDMDEDGFSQMCVPRTIEYLSKYLNTSNLDDSKSAASRASFIQHMETMPDGKTLLQVVVEGSVGTNDFTNKLLDKMSDFYRDLLQSANTTQQSLSSLPPFDKASFMQIATTGQIDLETSVIDSLDADTRINILTSLLIQQNVNQINDNALVKRTINNILLKNDPLPFAIKNSLFQLATTDPTLLSKMAIDEVASNSANTAFSDILPTLTQAVSY